MGRVIAYNRIRTRWMRLWWRWDKSSKPEAALDLRISPATWLRLFYFRHRPKAWYTHEVNRGWSTRKGRIIFDWPSFYPNEVPPWVA